jgi:hypothetical protein
MHLRIWPPLCVDEGEKEEDSVNLGETTFELLVGSWFVEPSLFVHHFPTNRSHSVFCIFGDERHMECITCEGRSRT